MIRNLARLICIRPYRSMSNPAHRALFRCSYRPFQSWSACSKMLFAKNDWFFKINLCYFQETTWIFQESRPRLVSVFQSIIDRILSIPQTKAGFCALDKSLLILLLNWLDFSLPGPNFLVAPIIILSLKKLSRDFLRFYRSSFGRFPRKKWFFK